MGIFRKTTNAIFGSDKQLQRVFTPCLPGDGNKTINIRIFDKHELVKDMAPAPEIVSGMQTFLDGMRSSVGLEPAVAASLSTFTFQVTYASTFPAQSEIDLFSRNDFPMYLMTAIGQFVSTKAEIVSLLEAHKIPENTFVGKRVGANANPVFAPAVHPYTDIETDWADDRTVLGFGIPGPYFIPNSQNVCRKLGIIKMQDFMIENLPPGDKRRAKLLAVLRHELGHMFAHVHEDNTLMDKNYDINSQFSNYTNDQIWLISRTLEVLTQP